MDLTFEPQHDEFRQEVREFIARELTEAIYADLSKEDEGYSPIFHKKLAAAGYVGMQWPKRLGGSDRSNVHMAIFYEEMNYALAPLGAYTGSVVFVGQSIAAYGNNEQRARLLPRIAAGEVTCCWCLSEPEAGSDLMNLQLRAVPAGGAYRLSGQKIFTSGAHRSDMALVASRTQPDKVGTRDGVSLFVVDMRSPGITIRPLWSMAGWRVNQCFFDNVEAPAENLLGRKDAGWNHILTTLGFERSAIGKVGFLMRGYDIMHRKVMASPPPAGSRVPHRLAQLRAEILTCRWMNYQIAWRQDQGEDLFWEASLSKLAASELIYEMSDLGMEIDGPAGLRRSDSHGAEGLFEKTYRTIPFYLIGGGTPEIQRNAIAMRGLNLPKR